MSARDAVKPSTQTPARPSWSRPSLQTPRDPGYAALRRASRAALVISVAFAFSSLVLHNAQNVIFVIFGCFALLVLADFGGVRRPRALAYLTATLVGAVLVALATLASGNAVLAAAAMLLAGFTISFSRVFGGYVAAAQTGLLLAFVIAVSIPAPPSAIAARVAGWALAGIISTLAAVFLWPRFERVMLHKQAAKAALAVADLVDGLGPDVGERDRARLLEAAVRAEQAARQTYASTAKRPAGPTRRDRAFIELLTELQRIIEVIERPFTRASPSLRPSIEESTTLTAAAVAALRASADVLTGGTRPNIRAVQAARDRHRVALDRWAAQELRAGRPTDEVLDGLDVDHTLRVVAYLVIALATNAVIAAGERPDVDADLSASAPRFEGISAVVVRVLRTIRTHLQPTSTVAQNSLRVAVGLAIAVFVARSLGLQHAFWVVLGTLQVLRSSALGTGRTTLQALSGNVIGVVIGGLFAALAGNDMPIMWAALPLTIFVAAYAATTLGFVASQAAFTINLIVIFNLISPAGWQVGLVRIEDVAVGAAISIVVGLLLWPRGARRELARSMAGFYRAVGAYLDHAFDRVLGFERAVGVVDPARRVASQARDRAGEAFDAYLNEKAASPLDPQSAGFLLSAGYHAMLAADLLDTVSGRQHYQAGDCPDSARTVHAQVQILLTAFLWLADRLALDDPKTNPEQVSEEALRGAELDCLRRWRNDDRLGRGAVAVAISGEWVRNLGRLEANLEQPVETAVAAARTPWWR